MSVLPESSVCSYQSSRTGLSHTASASWKPAAGGRAAGRPLVWPGCASRALTLCGPMNCSTPGLPVHHQLPESTQTHVHRVGDIIQPSYPLLSPSPRAPQSLPASGSFPMSQLLASGSQSIGVSASGLISFSMDWLDLLAVQGTLKSLLQYHSSKALYPHAANMSLK